MITKKIDLNDYGVCTLCDGRRFLYLTCPGTSMPVLSIESYREDLTNKSDKNKEGINMREIKPGDKIRVISDKGESPLYSKIVGKTYIVEDIKKGWGEEYVILENNPYMPYLYNCELVEKKEKQFTMSDLEDGDIVTHRNGKKSIVKKKKYFLPFECNAISLDVFNEDLTSKLSNSDDIMKIERPTLLYSRNEQTEMTLEEICKELGRDIKIVKEH